MLSAQAEEIKEITNKNIREVTCRLNIDKIERTTIAEDMCEQMKGHVFTFDYTGKEQEFKVSCEGNYKIELWGAQGENSGGKGAYTVGELHLYEEKILYIYVGSQNKSFNGGGNTYYHGGDATDVRLKNGNSLDFNGLKSRIMVAAGGGARAYDDVGNYFGDGHGGTLTGFDGYKFHTGGGCTPTNCYGIGATQTSGGQTSTGAYGYLADLNGRFGYGGTAKNKTVGTNPTRGGGGSGYYGGSAGSYGSSGGGSSFISGHPGCNAIAESSTQSNIVHTGQPNHYSGYVFSNTTMIAGNASMPTHAGNARMTGNTGNGYARITYIGK